MNTEQLPIVYSMHPCHTHDCTNSRQVGISALCISCETKRNEHCKIKNLSILIPEYERVIIAKDRGSLTLVVKMGLAEYAGQLQRFVKKERPELVVLINRADKSDDGWNNVYLDVYGLTELERETALAWLRGFARSAPYHPKHSISWGS